MAFFCKLDDGDIKAQTKKRLFVRRVVTEHLIRESRGSMGRYLEFPDNGDYFAEGEYYKILAGNYHDDAKERADIKEQK